MTEDDLKRYVATLSTNAALEVVRFVEHLKNRVAEHEIRFDAIARIVVTEDARQTLESEITQEEIGEIYRLAMGLYKCTEHIIEG